MLNSAAPPAARAQLAKALGVSTRTLYRDLLLLRSVNSQDTIPSSRASIDLKPVLDHLGSTLTLREAAALLLFFERQRQPLPNTAYHELLRAAGLKVATALKREVTSVASQLHALITTLDYL